MYCLALQGDSREVGFQHGRALRKQVQEAIEHRAFTGPGEPDTAQLDELEGRLEREFPALLAEIEGIADGAQADRRAVLTHNLAPLTAACSNLAFVCEDGPLLGHVNDDVEHRFDAAFHVKYADGRELLHVGTAGSVGTGAAVNSFGLAVSHACARSAGASNPNGCLNLPLLRRALVDACRDCSEAQEFLEAHHFRMGADNIIAVDRDGAALVAEKLPTALVFRYSPHGGIYCTGRQLHPDIRQIVAQDEYEASAPEAVQLVKRERYFDAVLAGDEGPHSPALMQRALQSAAPERPVCNELSNWAVIMQPRQFAMLLASRPPQKQEFLSVVSLCGSGEGEMGATS